MNRVVRIALYFFLFIFAMCQVPIVQKGIMRRVLPSSMQIKQMKSYGLFPFYVYIPTLVLQKNKQDFVTIKNGVLDLRYFPLHRKIAFKANQLVLHKQTIEAQTVLSVGEALAEVTFLTCLHDFNVTSLQYIDGENTQLDYKIDWDLKLGHIKLFAKRNGDGAHPERIEIEGTTKKNDIDEGHLKVIMNGGLGVDGNFTMKEGVIKTDLTLQRKDTVIAKIQPTVDIHQIDKGVSIEKLDIISPFFQLAGSAHVSVDPVVATAKNDRFFLGLAKKITAGTSH